MYIDESETTLVYFSVLNHGIVASGTLDGAIVLWTVDEHDIAGYLLPDRPLWKERHKDGLLSSAATTAKVSSLLFLRIFKILASHKEWLFQV